MSRKVMRVVGWTLLVIAIICTLASVALTIGLHKYLKSAVITVLRERFNSDVEIGSLRILVFPRVFVSASGIVLRRGGRTDIPPFFTADKLTASADLASLFRSPRTIASVHLDGLKINIPPRDPNAQHDGPRKIKMPVVLEEVTADDAVLVMIPRDPNKVPLEFDIHQLVMHELGPVQPAEFHAVLRNPKPVGDIDTSGQFGPWDPDDLSLTPVQGTFSFSNADLSTLKGISGILSSKGQYSGVLDKLDVVGDTDTPDFGLQFGGSPVDLKTHYIAVVDGTNGNTYLKPVTAHFLHSTIEASGEVVGVRGAKHRKILLEATASNARVEDLIHLVVKSDQPVMTGAATLKTTIDLPPIDGTLFEKLILNGQFGIVGAHFSSEGVQGKIDSLSRHGQGEPKNEDIENVISNLQGKFILKDKDATFSNLGFDVSGAKVQLTGTYNLENENLDFRGHLLLNAKLSQLTTGTKSFLLRPFDSIFKKNGAGTSLPIKISGTRSNPSFGLDIGHKDDKKNQQGQIKTGH
ncbi:MAG: hypothetical protein WAK91_00610 [Candidatus Acidiferrales bacterium]